MPGSVALQASLPHHTFILELLLVAADFDSQLEGARLASLRRGRNYACAIRKDLRIYSFASFHQCSDSLSYHDKNVNDYAVFFLNKCALFCRKAKKL